MSYRRRLDDGRVLRVNRFHNHDGQLWWECWFEGAERCAEVNIDLAEALADLFGFDTDHDDPPDSVRNSLASSNHSMPSATIERR